MAPKSKSKRGAPGSSWSSNYAGGGEDTAKDDDLHGMELKKHPSFRGHPGSMQPNPRDDTRRNMRALRKSKESEVALSALEDKTHVTSNALAVDPVVMRKIQNDLDKLARRKNERERSKRRGRAREEKDVEKNVASRIGGKVIHAPLANAAVDTSGISPSHTPSYGSSRRGSFMGVASGFDSEDDDTGSVASQSEKGNMRLTSPRARTPLLHQTQTPGETPDSLRYMEVMSRYLSNRGVYVSLLDELEEQARGINAETMTRTTSDATMDDETREEPSTPVSVLNTGERCVGTRSASRPPSHGRTPSGSAQTPVTPQTLSPAAMPFAFDFERRKQSNNENKNQLDAEPSTLRNSLAASIEHMRGAAALSPADRAFAAAAVDASEKSGTDDDETETEGGNGEGREDDLRRRRFTELRAALHSETPKPGSEEAETAEGTARIAAHRAGIALRNALDAAVAATVDGATKLGDAQHASADVLYELERASDACARAVDRALSSSKSPEAQAQAAVTHARLSSVVLEEVSSVAVHASWALSELSKALRGTSQAEAAAGEAAEEAAAAAIVENTDVAVAAAARADREADLASAETAAALVRAAHAGAYVAQLLGVYSRWAKRASGWAGHPPPPPKESSAAVTGLADKEAACEAADAVYARAVHDVVISWAGYIGASAAAAPPEDEEETSLDNVSDGDVSADDEETAFWAGKVPPAQTVGKTNIRHPGSHASNATRRSFLRSLWVQAFIAQSCVQSAFSTSRVSRVAKTDKANRDFDSLVRAAMRVIAVATTVEKQLLHLGDDANETAFGKFGLDVSELKPTIVPGSPERVLKGNLEVQTNVGDGKTTTTDTSMDYIDALWTSVSQVRSLRFEKAIKIGRGGFSTVLRATWRGSTVAVKVLDPRKVNGDVVDAIKREVTVMTANRHPHIVTVLAASVQLPDASIIMEHCAHGSLSDVLAKARKNPEKLCWRVRILMASDAACGLAYLHSSANMIAHRDFNTSNLLVTEDMRVKIADFGLSRLVRTAGIESETIKSYDADTDDSATTAGKRNCLFHAPEVITGVSNHGTKQDVWSFGVVLWCLASLAPPWEQVQDEYESLPDLPRFFQTMKAVSEKVVNGERLPLEESSQRKWSPAFSQQDELVQLIRKCFETDPDERPSMTSTLRVLKRMRRKETHLEFKTFPVPELWKGFTPAAVPHMSAVGLREKEREKDIETEPPETLGSSLVSVKIGLLLATVAVASFSIGRYWRAQ